MERKEIIEKHILDAMKSIDKAIHEIVKFDNPKFSDTIQQFIGAKQLLKYRLNKHFDKNAKDEN